MPIIRHAAFEGTHVAFVQNNIRFRSVASKALEYFYNSKAFMLNDLILEKNQFSEVARESLLLLFNSFSPWVSEVEYLLSNRGTFSADDASIIIDRFERIDRHHLNIFDIHKDVFVPRFMSIWLNVHEQTNKAFILRVRQAAGLPTMEAYPSIINALVTMLQSTLYELYEVDCLFGSNFVVERCTANRSNTNKLVAYVDNFALSYYRDTGIFLLNERVKAYLNVCCSDRLPLIIKNYSSEVISVENGEIEGNEPLASLLKQLQTIAAIIEIVSVPPTV